MAGTDVGGGEDVAVETGSRSAAAWLAVETRQSLREAARSERVGVGLGRWTRVAEAVAAGVVGFEQADVLVGCLDDLPAGLDPGLVARAQAHLVGEAAGFGPRELRVLGRRVLEVLAPEIAEEQEEAALAAEERRARAATRLSFRPRGDGSTDLHARLPEHLASRLRAYLDAMTSPRRHDPTAGRLGEVDRLPLKRRRGEAFCSLLEQVPADRLPQHGGTATSVMVMVDLETLRSGLGLAETSTGEVVTAAEARRLACTAAILPVVLGAKGESSTSAGRGGCSHRVSARRWRCVTGAVGPRAARPPLPGARPTTTTDPGPAAAAPTWPTGSCSAPSTTTAPTTATTPPPACPTATSATPGAPEQPPIVPRRWALVQSG